MSLPYKGMTRVTHEKAVPGEIFDHVEALLDDGFFINDAKIDIILKWLDEYANALECRWKRLGCVGKECEQEFVKVRSFKKAVDRLRGKAE